MLPKNNVDRASQSTLVSGRNHNMANNRSFNNSSMQSQFNKSFFDRRKQSLKQPGNQQQSVDFYNNINCNKS